MAKSWKPLIGTSTTFSVASGTSDINGETIRNDYPPNEENVASAFINPDGGGAPSATITVKFQLYSGIAWGPAHTCKDAAGTNITFGGDDNTPIEVNLYSQAEWKLADAWRIVLSRSSSTELSGTATAVVR